MYILVVWWLAFEAVHVLALMCSPLVLPAFFEAAVSSPAPFLAAAQSSLSLAAQLCRALLTFSFCQSALLLLFVKYKPNDFMPQSVCKALRAPG